MEGISFRNPNGRITHNGDGGFTDNLDALPTPAYHLLPMHRYRDGRGFRMKTLVKIKQVEP